jgi:nucleoside-diphosphate-sugar epimerase
MKLNKIFITGANGFVGRSLCSAAVAQGLVVKAATRTVCEFTNIGASFGVGTIDESTNWSAALEGADVVVHLAARTHIMNDAAADPVTEFRRVNVGGTINLARQAAKAGVRRFVFISSIKVNGESTQLGAPYTADDVSAPEDAYGISKAEAESSLRQLAQETGLEVVIIRPPLVYGPEVKGNFNSLLRWVARGLPLPFGSATCNRRSLVALDNLVDLILVCVRHPNAANQTFLVSDGEDLSTAELLQRIGKAMQRPVRLFCVPVGSLILAAALLGKKAVAQRLLGSLQVDISKTRSLLDWKPSVSVDKGLRRAVGQRQ